MCFRVLCHGESRRSPVVHHVRYLLGSQDLVSVVDSREMSLDLCPLSFSGPTPLDKNKSDSGIRICVSD